MKGFSISRSLTRRLRLGARWVVLSTCLTGGTGRFEEATGTFEGVGGRFNVLTGEDVGGYAGRISY